MPPGEPRHAIGMLREIVRLAWPVFVAQLAAIGNGVIDTVMAGRLSSLDLAAVSLGASIYVSVYIGLMGVLLALAPIVARHRGAGRSDEIGADVRQGVWVAAGLALLGCPLIAASDAWFALADPPDGVAAITAPYLLAIAAALPAALLFRVFYALHTGLGTPRVIMAINLGGLALKGPLNALFMFGAPALGLPAMGGAGCAIATAAIAWTTLGAAVVLLSRDPEYRRLGLWPWRFADPEPARLREILRLGVPTGLGYMIEVTSFTFIALFVARQGAVTGASHQIVANLAGLAYMLALAIANATSTLTAQALGAGDAARARLASATGLRTALAAGALVATLILTAREAIVAAYTSDAAVAATALPLMAWIAAYHLFDALQVTLSFSLRAYRIATLPMGIYAVALWGVGLGGGAWLTFVADPARFAGALGFWVGGTLGLAIAAIALAAVQWRAWRTGQAAAAPAVGGTSATAASSGARRRKVSR